MTKQDIIEYVMETPGNTNKAVLTSMLNDLEVNNTNNDNNDSDFIKATVTIINTKLRSYNWYISFNEFINGNMSSSKITGFYIDEEAGILTESDKSVFVDINDTVTIEVYVLKNHHIVLAAASVGDATIVEGDCIVSTITIDNQEIMIAQISGDCVITIYDPKGA